MSTATMNGTPATDFETLTAWLQNTDPAKLAGAIPENADDGGEKATEGARSSENDTDVKKITNGNAVPGSGQNPSGKMDNPIEGSGLNQSTTGKNPEVERAIKTVKGEEEKMAAADLDTPEGFKAAHDALISAYSQLPILLAHCGVEMPVQEQKTAAAQSAAKKTETPVQAGDPAAAMGFATKEAADKAAAEVVAGYQRLGYERAALTAQYLRGFDDTTSLITKMADDGSLEAAMAAHQGGGGGGGSRRPPSS
jgi:hypothetical protein